MVTDGSSTAAETEEAEEAGGVSVIETRRMRTSFVMIGRSSASISMSLFRP
jgi:hypothetical protein